MQSLVMGVLNVTPDSFSDGGNYLNIKSAVAQAEKMLKEGASIIDIGGQSSRPGAHEVSAVEETNRVLPVIKALKNTFPAVKISVDTYRPEVIAAALPYDIWAINDITALANPASITLLKGTGVKVCLMHMQNRPHNMQEAPAYDNVLHEVYSYLANRVNSCIDSGIAKDNLYIDPGFGFGKSLAHNKILLKNLAFFKKIGVPILVGMSRKSMLGDILNKPVNDRLYGGIAAAVIACINGAAIIRTHDVAATVDALKVTEDIINTNITEELL
ncbi:MAG: dihydropteroate synthase [Legionellales bacterium]|jgi:dihydropteroate synthase|nr:dihydropteroate synthase [Legionellales bacterium]